MLVRRKAQLCTLSGHSDCSCGTRSVPTTKEQCPGRAMSVILPGLLHWLSSSSPFQGEAVEVVAHYSWRRCGVVALLLLCGLARPAHARVGPVPQWIWSSAWPLAGES